MKRAASLVEPGKHLTPVTLQSQIKSLRVVVGIYLEEGLCEDVGIHQRTGTSGEAWFSGLGRTKAKAQRQESLGMRAATKAGTAGVE